MSNSNPMRNPSLWKVVAELEDGSIIRPDDFVYEINRVRTRVKKLGVHYNGQYRGTVDLTDPEQRLILFARNIKVIGVVSNQEISSDRVIHVGWQMTVNGRNVRCVMQLNNDGTVIVRNNDPVRLLE